MKLSWWRTTVVVASLALAQGAWAATITGNVKGPDGAPFRAAFVRARNESSNVIVSVLSDKQGQYRIESLPTGEYEIAIKATGYKAEPQSGVKVDAAGATSINFALQKSLVRWSDLSMYEGAKLLPEGKGKEVLTGTCFLCHGFQSREAPRRQDEASWQRDVGVMMDRFGYFVRRQVNDAKAAEVASYLTRVFGPDSKLPQSPAELPQYREVKYPSNFSDDGLKISYVEFKLAGTSRFPGAGRPGADGNIWIWQYNGNRLAMLDPKTGQVKEWPVPYPGQASIHSEVLAPDGLVWFSDQAQNKIGKLDPKTGHITVYDGPPLHPDKTGMDRGSKHTLAIDPQGNIWSTGSPLSKFDPKTEKFTNYPEVPTPYGVAADKQGNVWFSEFSVDGKIGKVDAKTGRVIKYTPPTAGALPRRLKLDSKEMVWFAEYRAGQIARFDPKTETFKEYPLPGPSPTPYALEIDRNGRVWYSSMDMDVVGQLDPASGGVVEYPFPYSENGIRDFFMDSEGRIWWGSQANDRVGYFVPVAARGAVPAARNQPQQPSAPVRAE